MSRRARTPWRDAGLGALLGVGIVVLAPALFAGVEGTGVGTTVGGGGGGAGLVTPVTGDYDISGRWSWASAGGANAVELGETAGRVTFEGATADGFEGRLGWADPTVGDQVILLPDLAAATTDTLVTLAATQTITNKTLGATTLTGTLTHSGVSEVHNSSGAGTVPYLTIPGLSLLTGVNNLCAGSGACAALTTSTQSVVIGDNAGDGASTSMTDSVFIGFNAGTGSAIGAGNTAIGARALDVTSNTSAVSNVCVGSDACDDITTGANNICVGDTGCNVLTTGGGNTMLGHGTAVGTNNLNNSIALGRGATTTASNQMVIGGNGTQVTDIYISEGVTNATALDVTINTTGGSGTDNPGAALILAGGKGTGTGAGGDLIGKTSPALATGTTLQTLETRSLIRAKQFTVADNTATTFAVQTLGNDTGGGGTIHYCVYAADATTAGLECGNIDFAGVDVTSGAGGEVCSNPTKVGTPLQALSGSTLTVTFAATTGTDLCNLRVTADTNIATPVELWIKYHVVNSGRTITPQ